MTGYVRTCLVDSCSPVDFAMGSVVSGIAMDSKNIYWGEQTASGNVTVPHMWMMPTSTCGRAGGPLVKTSTLSGEWGVGACG
jgi:hypothetical protein